MEIRIPLTRGKEARIDDWNLDIILEYVWRAQQNQDGRWYAMAWDTPRPNFVLMHRVIMKPSQGQVVDHLDGDGLNNLEINLHICSYGQNSQRGVKRMRATSVFKGVHWESSRNKWKACITKDNKLIFLGRYANEVDAAKAYDDAALELFGQLAYTNFDDDEDNNGKN